MATGKLGLRRSYSDPTTRLGELRPQGGVAPADRGQPSLGGASEIGGSHFGDDAVQVRKQR